MNTHAAREDLPAEPGRRVDAARLLARALGTEPDDEPTPAHDQLTEDVADGSDAHQVDDDR